MEWVETTGRTVDEAKRAALEQLGVGEPDAEFEVVAEPRVGLFGRLKEEARVRARLLPRYPRSKGDRRDRRRNVPDRQRGRPSPTDAQAPSSPARPSGTQVGTQPRQVGRQRRPARGAQAREAVDGASVPSVDKLPPPELARIGEEFLLGLLARLGCEATVTSQAQTGGLVEFSVKGNDLGLLIGPKGTTLLALQELTRVAVQRRLPHAETRLVVDVNDYRKRRHEALARFAKQVAEQVLATNTRRALEPMPPSDRKVVHDAINELPGVTTTSEGEEPNRRVVIIPEEFPAGTSSAADRDPKLDDCASGPGETALSGSSGQ